MSYLNIFYHFSLRITGLEPARHGHQNLNLARLPIPPHPHISYSIIDDPPRGGRAPQAGAGIPDAATALFVPIEFT